MNQGLVAGVNGTEGGEGCMARARRDKGEGSIFPWRDGFRGYLTLEDGQRKYVTRRARAEVQKKLREAERSAERGVNLLAERVTVAGWCERWLSTREIEVTTRSKYDTCCRLHIALSSMGRRQLSKLRAEAMWPFMPKCHSRRGGNVARPTRSRESAPGDGRGQPATGGVRPALSRRRPASG